MTSYAHSRKSVRRPDDLQFKIVFALSFVVFLAGTVLQRLMPHHWHDEHHRSIFAQAWEASGTAAQIAFSG